MVVGNQHFGLQHDGATAHTTVRMREWLEGNRVISRFSCCPLFSCAPDMLSLEYWLWSVCLAELRKRPSAILEELITTVEG